MLYRYALFFAAAILAALPLAGMAGLAEAGGPGLFVAGR